jgi:hypothetical protein
MMESTNVTSVGHHIATVKAGTLTSRHTEDAHLADYVAKCSVEWLYSICIYYRCMAFRLLNLEALDLVTDKAATEVTYEKKEDFEVEIFHSFCVRQ